MSLELYSKLQNKFFHLVRDANNVYCTTSATYEDIINYAGVKKDKVQLLPIDYSLPNFDEKLIDITLSNYIFWPTNCTIHKNHKNILLGLFKYWKHNPYGFSIVISGFYTHKFDPDWKKSEEDSFDHPYFKLIRALIEESGFMNKITFIGYADDKIYNSYLRSANYMLHGNLADNGTYNVIDSTFFSVPCLVTDYTAMRYLDRYFNLDMTFMNPRDSNDILEKLLYMENSISVLQNKIQNNAKNIPEISNYDTDVFLDSIQHVMKKGLISKIKSFFFQKNISYSLDAFYNQSNDITEYFKALAKDNLSYIVFYNESNKIKTLMMIKIYKILLREKYTPCKLFIVGQEDDESTDFINDNRLIFDILYFKDSPINSDLSKNALLVIESDKKTDNIEENRKVLYLEEVNNLNEIADNIIEQILMNKKRNKHEYNLYHPNISKQLF